MKRQMGCAAALVVLPLHIMEMAVTLNHSEVELNASF